MPPFENRNLPRGMLQLAGRQIRTGTSPVRVALLVLWALLSAATTSSRLPWQRGRLLLLLLRAHMLRSPSWWLLWHNPLCNSSGTGGGMPCSRRGKIRRRRRRGQRGEPAGTDASAVASLGAAAGVSVGRR